MIRRLHSTIALPSRLHVELKLTGLTCPTCAQNLEAALGSRAGVRGAAVSDVTSRAFVEFDPRQIGTADLIQIISGAGYEAIVATRAADGPDLRASGVRAAARPEE